MELIFPLVLLSLHASPSFLNLASTPPLSPPPHRFEKHFNHHMDQSLAFLNLHAARENSGILPLIVRLKGMEESGKNGAGGGY